MSQQLRSAGFFGMVTLLTLVAAGLLGSYWLFEHKTKEGMPAGTINTNSPQSSETTHKTQHMAGTSQAEESEAGKYLVITEWGVQFKLPTALRGDVKYMIKAMSNSDEIAYFEVRTIAQFPGSDCKLSSSSGMGIGAYLKRTSTNVSKDEAAGHLFANRQISDAFYSGGRDKYSHSCMSNIDHIQQTIDIRGELTHSLASLEKSPAR